MNCPQRPDTRPDQSHFAEATAINRRLVEGKQVQLEFDGETFDQFGGSLAYVWVDGLLANLKIVR